MHIQTRFIQGKNGEEGVVRITSDVPLSLVIHQGSTVSSYPIGNVLDVAITDLVYAEVDIQLFPQAASQEGALL